MPTVYTTYVAGQTLYSGPSLESAARAWDGATYSLGKSVAGGVAVAEYAADGVQTRDGWIMHVHEDGTVYLSTSLRG